jgi:hypothetical protein
MIFLGTSLGNDWLALQGRKRKKTLVYTKGRDGNPSTRSTRQTKAQEHIRTITMRTPLIH